MKPTRSLLIVMAVTAASMINQTTQAQTDLKWKFSEGKKLNYSMEQKMDMVMNVMGQEIETAMTQIIDMTWKVGKVAEDGSCDMTQVIDRIRYMMEGGPIGKVEYDSKSADQAEGPIAQALGPVFGSLVGGEFTMKMSSTGDLSNVEMPKKFKDTLENLGAGAAQLPLNEGSLKQMMGQSGVIFPKEPVSKGKSWEKAMEVAMPFGKMKLKNMFTYQGKEKDLEKIGIKTDLKMEANPDSPVPIEINLKSQNAEGAVLFDNVAGVMKESKLKQTMVMELSAGGNDFEQVIDQTITVKLVEKSPGEE